MPDEVEDIDPNLIPTKFHFYKLKFIPYANSGETSHTILHKVITFLNQEQQAGRGILIDRHDGRRNDLARPLFVTQAVFMFKEKRMRLSMALLRTGKIPMLKPLEQFRLIPLDTSHGEIAEVTNFFIDHSSPTIVMCVEFNGNGPRFSDIEYYFRIVARDKLAVAKGVELEMFMDTSIEKTLAEFKNVLNIEVKVQPKNLNQIETQLTGQYFTGITNLGQHVKPKFVKLEVMFQTPGKQTVGINKEGNTMFRSLLTSFKQKKSSVDAFEHFVVKYEDKDGKEEIFNLLKGKKEITKYIDVKNPSTRKIYELIDDEFTLFVNTLQ